MATKKSGSSQPAIYFLHGEATFLAEEMLSELRRRLFALPEEANQNFFRYYLKETSWTEIIENLRTGELFPTRKKLILVILPAEREEKNEKEEKNTSNKGREYLTPSEEKLISAYVADPAPETILIVYYPGRINKNSRIYRLWHSFAPSQVEEKEFNLLRGKQLENWVHNRLGGRGKRISPEALSCLLEATGADLQLLAIELDKLCVYTGSRKQVELEDVAALCPTVRSHREYELTQALEQGARNRGFRLLTRLLEEKSEEYVVGILVQFCRELLLAKEWLDEGKDEEEVFRALRPQIQPAFDSFWEKREAFIRAVCSLSKADLVFALSKLHSLDQALKMGTSFPQINIEEFLSWYFERRERRKVNSTF